MTIQRVHFDEARIAELCRRHGVRRLSLFGSALRSDFNDKSDLDLLVEFQQGKRVSLFDLGGMLMELRELLGREIDLRTPEDLSGYFREDVLRTAQALYAA